MSKYPRSVSIVSQSAPATAYRTKSGTSAAVRSSSSTASAPPDSRNVGQGPSCRPSGCRRWRPRPRSWPASRASPASSIRYGPTSRLRGRAGGPRRRVVIFGAASEAFSQKNINCSRSPRALSASARSLGGQSQRHARAARRVVCALGCPRGGYRSIGRRLRQRFADLGCDDIRHRRHHRRRHPGGAVVFERPRPVRWRRSPGHFHDTLRRAAPTCSLASRARRQHLRPSVAGLGGLSVCQRARPATSRPRTCCTCCTAWASKPASTSTASAAGQFISRALGRAPHSRVNRALAAETGWIKARASWIPGLRRGNERKIVSPANHVDRQPLPSRRPRLRR